MQVKGVQTIRENVIIDVNPNDVMMQLKDRVFRDLGVPTDVYLNKNGELCQDEEHHTSHSWHTTKVIEASPETIADVKTMLDAIRLVKTRGTHIGK